MLAKILISPSLETRVGEITKLLASHLEGVNLNFKSHPDILYFESEEKLGIEQARKIKEHFSLRPYQIKGRVVILEDASSLTPEAQNALLKVLEEPPEEAVILLGVSSEANLLPTILSRCQVVRLQNVIASGAKQSSSDLDPTTIARLAPRAERATLPAVVRDDELKVDIEKLIQSNIEERFEYVEKLKDKSEFLFALIKYFRNLLTTQITSSSTIEHHDVIIVQTRSFLNELLQAEQWANQNVNLRGILEYLMLRMPTI